MTRENCIPGILFALSLLVLVGVLGSPAQADDVVILKNHSRFEGQIVSDTLDKIKIATNVGVIEFPKSMVRKVLKEGANATGPSAIKGLYRPATCDTKRGKTPGAKSDHPTPAGPLRTVTGAPAKTTTKPDWGGTRYGREKALPRFDWDAPSVWPSQRSSGANWFLPSKSRESSWKPIRPAPTRSGKTDTRRLNRNRRTMQRNVPVWRQNCNQVKQIIRRRG